MHILYSTLGFSCSAFLARHSLFCVLCTCCVWILILFYTTNSPFYRFSSHSLNFAENFVTDYAKLLKDKLLLSAFKSLPIRLISRKIQKVIEFSRNNDTDIDSPWKNSLHTSSGSFPSDFLIYADSTFTSYATFW